MGVLTGDTRSLDNGSYRYPNPTQHKTKVLCHHRALALLMRMSMRPNLATSPFPWTVTVGQRDALGGSLGVRGLLA